MAVKGSQYVQGKIIVENKVIEQIKEFDYFGCSASCIDKVPVWNAERSEIVSNSGGTSALVWA